MYICIYVESAHFMDQYNSEFILSPSEFTSTTTDTTALAAKTNMQNWQIINPFLHFTLCMFVRVCVCLPLSGAVAVRPGSVGGSRVSRRLLTLFLSSISSLRRYFTWLDSKGRGWPFTEEDRRPTEATQMDYFKREMLKSQSWNSSLLWWHHHLSDSHLQHHQKYSSNI